MKPVKNPTALLQKTRQLNVGETIQPGDYVTITSNDNTLLMYELTELDTRFVNVVVNQYSSPVHRLLPKPDPMIAATKRIRAKTRLGQLEKLLAERAIARRRLTMALNRLDFVEKSIAGIAGALAEAALDSDLAQINRKTNAS